MTDERRHTVDMPARTALALAFVALATACSGDQALPEPSATTVSTVDDIDRTPRFVPPGETTVPTDSTVPTSRPEGAPADNAFVILGDTLGIGDACAGRNDLGDVEYRYDLSNGGSLVITLDEGRAVGLRYEGRSGAYTGSGDDITDTSADDGFVTGSGTVSQTAEGAADAAATSAVSFRATIPVRNCSTPTEDTSTTVVAESTTTTEA